jgi:hypothetical protein
LLLSIRFGGDVPDLLAGEEERHEEFWFGEGFAWKDTRARCVYCSLRLEIPRIVARTKRRDREERFAVGFCDPYAYSATGLKALFLARLRMQVSGNAVGQVGIEVISYPEREHSAAIASRLFAPLGYRVQAESGRLRLEGERKVGDALRELPVLLLALDRRTRLFLSQEELLEIGSGAAEWIRLHPARRAIELALEGRATPLRLLIPAGSDMERKRDVIEDASIVPASARLSSALIPKITVSDEQWKHAIRIFSRMNIDQKWLIYLPAAVASIQRGGVGNEIERPEQALCYFRDELVEKAVVEEKHMGSRGIVVLCRTDAASRERFGVEGELPGCVYTRNGRRFFPDEDTEAVFLERVGEALVRTNFWKRFQTEWVCFDGEILPWSVKAAESAEESGLVEAGMLALGETFTALNGRDSALRSYWRNLVESELRLLGRYDSMFKRYRLQEANLAAIKFAPFHLIAIEGQHFFDRSHLWHMQVLGRIARSGGGILIPTRYEMVDTDDAASWQKTIRWWEEITNDASEGLVIKPLPFVPQGRRGLAQPALKCRSREHLRLVYGPRYDSTEARELLLSRDALLHRRNKHRRILRQFALSMEAVTRFVQRNSIEAIHECLLGVLAQEVAPKMKT